MDMLSNYQGYKKNHLIVVFDAYKVEGGMGSVQKCHNIHVIFTKEAETADQYIEKTVREIGKKYNVTVATSDALEQIIILGAGAARMSASDLYENMQLMSNELRETYLQPEKGSKNYLFDHLSEELTEVMEAVRLGEQEL
jgi:predicted RNA-binding protein with PIN domain